MLRQYNRRHQGGSTNRWLERVVVAPAPSTQRGRVEDVVIGYHLFLFRLVVVLLHRPQELVKVKIINWIYLLELLLHLWAE